MNWGFHEHVDRRELICFRMDETGRGIKPIFVLIENQALRCEKAQRIFEHASFIPKDKWDY